MLSALSTVSNTSNNITSNTPVTSSLRIKESFGILFNSDDQNELSDRSIFRNINMKIPRTIKGVIQSSLKRQGSFKNKFSHKHDKTDVSKLNLSLVIVGVSANCDALSKHEALESGMDHFISKPFNYKDLLPIINDHFSNDKI